MSEPKYEVKVGLASCSIAAGAAKVYGTLKETLAGLDINVQRTGCMGMCYCEPLVEVIASTGESYIYGNVTPKNAQKIVQSHIVEGEPVEDLLVMAPGKETEANQFIGKQQRFLLHNSGNIDPESIQSYLEAGGYEGLYKVLKNMSPQNVIEEVKSSGLRGRGGAGFPTFQKWIFTRQAKGEQKYILCNADEGDPGAFMDRSILESDPHSVLEGMLIAGYAIGASAGYLYIRAEYPLAVRRLKIAIEQAIKMQYLGNNILDSGYDFNLEIREGAGAFVCGEETALIMSIEGKRGMPRFRPPFPAQSGLFGCPTSTNNVETFAAVPRIIALGAAAYNKYGTELSRGTKVFALAGKIKRGGLIEIPMGTTINDIVFNIGGGIPTGKPLKAVQTGGPSGGCIPAALADTPVDYEALKEIGTIMGSGGLLIMDEDTCMVDVAKYFLTFTRQESCGKCTFCRVGTEQMLRIMERITGGKGKKEDIDTLLELGKKIKEGSLCGLGQSLPNPVLTTIKYFRDEYESHVLDKECPARKCKALIQYEIVAESCRGCGLCVKQCPVDAISGRKQQPYVIDTSKCLNCGLCQNVCKFDSIVINSRPRVNS